MSFSLGASAVGFSATAVSEGERARQGVGRNVQSPQQGVLAQGPMARSSISTWRYSLGPELLLVAGDSEEDDEGEEDDIEQDEEEDTEDPPDAAPPESHSPRGACEKGAIGRGGKE